MKYTAINLAMIQAIREDKVIGRGTCSSIDECFSDADLIALLSSEGINSVPRAVKWARDHERVRLDRMLDCRWGEDTDEELSISRAFDKACEDNPLAMWEAGKK